MGNLQDLPDSLRKEIDRSMEDTKHNQGIQFTVATNYGGRQEIIQACKAIASKVEQGYLDSSQISEELFEQHLYTQGIPHPDLLIRTSGEMRISNFLLWQLAYTEIYITEKLWPDFRKDDLRLALKAFQNRERRFGRISEQVNS